MLWGFFVLRSDPPGLTRKKKTGFAIGLFATRKLRHSRHQKLQCVRKPAGRRPRGRRPSGGPPSLRRPHHPPQALRRPSGGLPQAILGLRQVSWHPPETHRRPIADLQQGPWRPAAPVRWGRPVRCGSFLPTSCLVQNPAGGRRRCQTSREQQAWGALASCCSCTAQLPGTTALTPTRSGTVVEHAHVRVEMSSLYQTVGTAVRALPATTARPECASICPARGRTSRSAAE